VVDTTGDIWRWQHNVSECYYHLQLTVKYRKNLFVEEIEQVVMEVMAGFKDRYEIEVHTVGFDANHVHVLCRFLPKYTGGQVVRLMKSFTAREIFRCYPGVKQRLWDVEFWSDGYYIATVSGNGDKKEIEEYIKNKGRQDQVKQLRFFEL
jgi:putative transposase